ncbi:MAG: hypothetical protein K8R40_08115 [Anaerolineaceae bacterium]|nr:hypothetical protein [Anaerolineaceae bacterium]
MSVEKKENSSSEKNRGQSLVEYALLLVFVVLAVIVMLTLLHEVIRDAFCSIILKIGGDGGTICPVSLLPMNLLAWV